MVLAGSGDNGGDALYAAAQLARRGTAVLAVAAGSRIHDGGAAALRAAGGRIVGSPMTAAVAAAVDQADLILDGMLGIGGQGGLREPYATLAAAPAARSAATVVAVDLPSGVDADTGRSAGAAVRADVTVTFGTWKPGLLVDPGASYAGVTELVDIGLDLPDPPDVVSAQAADIAALLPSPTADSDKYRRGVVGLVSGSEQYTGAAVLSVGGAIRGGAGMIRFLSAQPAVDLVRQWWPETVITVAAARASASGGGGNRWQDTTAADFLASAGRVQAWVAGPGHGHRRGLR